MDTIPATVAVLTHNSEKVLSKALAGVTDFSEILICDGESVDATREIATSFLAHIIAQDKMHLYPDGRIKDFSGIRNQTLQAAHEKWFLFLDDDEELSPEGKQAIARAISTEVPTAFWVPRLYRYEGKIITCSIAYPNKQMRFFHKDTVLRFEKPVHERVVLAPAARVDALEHGIIVPIQGSVHDAMLKSDRYINAELSRYAITLKLLVKYFAHALKISLLYLYRFVRNLFRHGTRLPLSFEFLPLWYQWRLVSRATKQYFHT